MKYTKEILEIVRELHPGAILGSVLLWAFVFFIIPLLLLIVFRKKVLVERKYKLLKYLAYSYFAIIPLLAALFGAKFGGIKAAEKLCIEKISEQKATIDSYTGNYASQLIVGNPGFSSDAYSNMSIEEMIGKMSTQTAELSNESIGAYGKNGEGITHKLALYLNKITSGKLFGKLFTKAIADVLHDKLHLPEGATNKIMHTEFNNLIKNGLITEIFIAQIQSVFKGLKKGALMPVLLIFLIPLIEILIAHYIIRKNKGLQSANTSGVNTLVPPIIDKPIEESILNNTAAPTASVMPPPPPPTTPAPPNLPPAV